MRKLVVTILLAAWAGAGNMQHAKGIDAVTGDSILDHIKTLASDAFEGRAPGTAGEERTVAYLTETFRKLGLAPGNPDGTYVQRVPFVGYTARPTGSFEVKGASSEFAMPAEGLAVSHRVAPEVKVDGSDVVFVGYGAVAPEYDWDDFKGVDVRGKTVVLLVGDPPVPDPKDPSKLDEKTFKGRAMSYYGRWTYKYEIASARGAAACVIVHETEPAGYPYAVLERGYGQEYFDIRTPDGNAGRVAVEAWMTVERARKLFADCGSSYDELKKAAARRDFKPVALGAKASFDVKLKTREVASRNCVARVEGADPKLKNEYVVYSAHWDHFGKGAGKEGDQIFNGAIDDGSGCAEILEIARAFATGDAKPKRSILFLFTTGEEQGLLGAKWYGQHPLYPLDRTLADINLDIMNMWGRTKSVVSISLGATTLDEILADVAAKQGRRVVADPEPEKGYFYRSDHLELMRQGVPALTFLHPGADYVDKPADYGEKKRIEYVTHDYHKPTDEVRADWDMAGAVDDVRMLYEVGRRVADGDRYPEWKPGAEFKAKRDATRRGASSSTPSTPGADPWTPQRSGTTASLRGLAAVDARVAWTSGTGGTWARTTDGGETWTAGVVPDATALDFRDVHAFDADNALVLSSGDDARIYRTADGGRSWRLVWRKTGPGVFFDGLAFWDDRHGIAIGDPVDGRFAVMTTDDGGATWTEATGLPATLPNEAAFAASGTCLAVEGSSNVWFGTGGASVARVFRSTDRGRTWTVAETPVRAGAASAGIFSLVFRDAKHGVAVGGDYKEPDAARAVAATTDDGGRTWRLVEGAGPSGYRSAVAAADKTTLVAVGTSGSDVSRDGGRTWTPLGATGFNAVAFAKGAGWAAGADGRVARLSR
jgi:Zn-dependent M28 family amino/carboxypeptidase/photosystem II stability/assembly factor-like uncharacterized protein